MKEENREENKEEKEIKRQKCQVITRVMGYLRGVENYNIGKKSEFYSRIWFTEEKTKNSIFKERFK